jgi:hypothetical protein
MRNGHEFGLSRRVWAIRQDYREGRTFAGFAGNRDVAAGRPETVEIATSSPGSTGAKASAPRRKGSSAPSLAPHPDDGFLFERTPLGRMKNRVAVAGAL